MHRPANVDDPVIFGRILDALEVIQSDMPIIFPVHPRTRKNLVSSSFRQRIERQPNLRLIDALGYLDFLKLMSSAKLVLTDSGGVQEETTALKVPCLTLRKNTERPITVEIGSNQVVGTDTDKIIEAYKQVVNGRLPNFPSCPTVIEQTSIVVGTHRTNYNIFLHKHLIAKRMEIEELLTLGI